MGKPLNGNSMEIAILGYGTEGKALAQYFKRRKANITIFDQNPNTKVPLAFKAVTGPHAFDNLAEFDAVFKSPGIPPHRLGDINNLTSLTQFFLANCPCPVIAVTGTKGKGTTATLIYEILKAAGYDTYLGGNIGVPPTEFLGKLKKSSIVVLEISSFQAQGLTQGPHTAVILMTTRDHMDYHTDIEEYHSAKAALVAHQGPDDRVIANADHPISLKIAKKSRGALYTVSTRKKVATGAELNAGRIVLKFKGRSIAVCKTSDVALLGPHNLENVLAACATAALYDVAPETMGQVIRAFKGLPHRLEFIKTISGTDYYNDSFSVNPEAAIAGVRSFKAPLHLIAGGYERFADFTEWAKVCLAQKNLKTIIFTGNQSAVRMFEELKKHPPRKNLRIVRLLNLREAVIAAKTYAKKGDIVLFSPGCPSFDEFTNYKERGETFKTLIQGISEQSTPE